jgi:hypothetical protein
MELKRIHSFADFCEDLTITGFSTSTGSEGVFGLADYFEHEIAWHTQNLETDPWEWRMRVLNERNDIAYAKIFNQRSGFITKEWYPYFLAVRRPKETFEDAYQDGRMSSTAKRIMNIVKENKVIALPEIKKEGNFNKEDKLSFDRGLCELQMHMFITICTSKKKISNFGNEYGWNSTVFCLSEGFFGSDVFSEAENLTWKEAYETIEEQIFQLNPKAEDRKIKKYILG